MIDVLVTDYFRQHNIERIKRGISTKAIWPEASVVDVDQHPWLGSGPGFLREIRIAPAWMHFTMGYWVYGANVAVLSSVQECFGFVLESEEFARMMEVQHLAAWKQSHVFKTDGSAVRDFAARYGDKGAVSGKRTSM